MATIKRFEDIEAWQKARALCKEIYTITKEGDFSKDFRFRDQIRAASGSIMDNIAEGFERGARGEFIQFLGYSKGSCGEVQSQLYRALDFDYIHTEKFEYLYNEATQISKMIAGWIEYLNKSEFQGTRKKK
jgi:four helix bundle protein